MILYTCGNGTKGPAKIHPCAKAAKALDAAGHDYEIKQVGGSRLLPWTLGRRDEVKRISGSPNVPVLVLDDGTVIRESTEIVRWAEGA
jgi:glutathione S-transferase